MPSFWIADNKDDTKGLKVRVVGWARNFAVIYDAMVMYNKVKPGEQPTDKQIVTDDMLNVPLPFPLPAVGAQVKITGAYNVAKTVVSDMVSEPTGGVMALQKVDTLQPRPSRRSSRNPSPDTSFLAGRGSRLRQAARGVACSLAASRAHSTQPRNEVRVLRGPS